LHLSVRLRSTSRSPTVMTPLANQSRSYFGVHHCNHRRLTSRHIPSTTLALVKISGELILDSSRYDSVSEDSDSEKNSSRISHYRERIDKQANESYAPTN
jgi:hypothetical protein